MQTGPEKQMISMFEEAIELSSQFKKATYEPTFRGFFERRRPELARMLKEIREKDEGRRKQLIQVLGTEVPEYLGLQSGIGDIFYSIAALQPGSRAGGGGGRDDFLLEPD